MYGKNTMPLYSILGDYIKECGLSKNHIIKETGIDRSTFFQILNGRRMITSSQFKELIKVLLRDGNKGCLPDELYEAFQVDRIGEHKMYRRATVRNWLNELNSRLSENKECDPLSIEPNSSLKCFMPVPYVADYIAGNIREVQLLINPDESFGNLEDRLIFLIFLIDKIRSNEKSCIQVYVQNNEIDSRVYNVVAHPYYAVSRESLIRFDYNMSKKEKTHGEELISEYVSAFDDAIKQAAPVVQYFISKQEYEQYKHSHYENTSAAVLSSKQNLNTDRIKVPDNISIGIDYHGKATVYSETSAGYFVLNIYSAIINEALADYITNLWEDNAIF